MNSADRATLVQEFFFYLSNPEQSELGQLVDIAVSVDLDEFELSEAEIQKLRGLAQRLELALLTEFTRHWTAASVIVEVRSS